MQCVDGIHSIFNNFHRFFYINFHNFSIFLKKKKYCFIKSDIHYIFVNSKYCMNHFFIIIQSKLFTQRFMYRNLKFLYFFFNFLCKKIVTNCWDIFLTIDILKCDILTWTHLIDLPIYWNLSPVHWKCYYYKIDIKIKSARILLIFVQ